MKYTNLLAVAALVLTGSTLANLNTVKADDVVAQGDGVIATADKAATATTTAEFAVKAGNLSLMSAPDFNFGTISLPDLITGVKAQPLSSNDVKNQVAEDNHVKNNGLSTDTDKLTVQDYRGLGDAAKWTLSAQLGDFTGKKGSTITGATITLPAMDNLTTEAKTFGSSVTEIIAKTGTNENGIYSAGLNKNVTLNVKGTGATMADTYDAPITWTLSTVETGVAKG